jgi:hypothetical protein
LLSAGRSGSNCLTLALWLFHAYFLEMLESHKSRSSVDYQLSTLHKVVFDLNMSVCVVLISPHAIHIFTHIISHYIHDLFPRETTIIRHIS